MSDKLFLQERREQILALLEQDGRVAVVELSERFGLSKATIRHDLETLAQQGLLLRTHGGAIPMTHHEAELSFYHRQRLRTIQKEQIGLRAAQLVQSGEAIALDCQHHCFGYGSSFKPATQVDHFDQWYFYCARVGGPA